MNPDQTALIWSILFSILSTKIHWQIRERMKIVANVRKMVQNVTLIMLSSLDYLCSLRSFQSTCKIFIPMNLLYRFRSSCYTWNYLVFKSSVNPDQKPDDPDPDCFPLMTANDCMKNWDIKVLYSKTCVKWPLKNRQNKGLNDNWYIVA